MQQATEIFDTRKRIEAGMGRRSGHAEQVKRCYEVHGMTDGCRQDIPLDNPWRYCPLCGRSTGHLQDDDSSRKNSIAVPPGEAQTKPITLRNIGLSPVRVTLELKSKFALQLNSKQPKEFILDREMHKQVLIDLPALTQNETNLGTLKISVHDNPLDQTVDPWDGQDARVRDVFFTLSAVIQTVAEIHIVEGAAIFHDHVEERRIHLKNSGKSAAKVEDIFPPDGYEVFPELEGNTIFGEAEKVYLVRRTENMTPGTSALLYFRTDRGQEPSVELALLPSGEEGRRNYGIVGIDFGTTNTTVAFRICRHNRHMEDDTQFIPPLGEPDNEFKERFPTYVWVGQDGSLVFGKQAERKYVADISPDAGFLFSEIKTGLRSVEGVRVHSQVGMNEEDLRERAIRRVTEQFGANWVETLVSEYLRWLYDDCIPQKVPLGARDEVRYVFSVPVLDYSSPPENLEEGATPEERHPQYSRQLATMKKCVEQAGFPYSDIPEENRVDFEFEPVCASLGLLHVPRDARAANLPPEKQWPSYKQGGSALKPGDTIAVFDSGGGTTDVVLVKVARDETDPEKVTLPVLSCLGVGSQGETFGGEWVTDQVSMAMGSSKESAGFRASLPSSRWYEGGPDVFKSLGRGGYNPSDSFDPRLWDDRKRAHDLKVRLAKGEKETVFSSETGTTRIDPGFLWVLCTGKLGSLNRELAQRVFKPLQRRAAKYLFIGGNTRLSAFKKWTQAIMEDETGRRMMVLPDRYLQTAVAYGAVWVPDARIHNAVPYDLRVVAISSKKEDEIFRQDRYQSQNLIPKLVSWGMSGYSKMKVEVRAAWGEKFHCVAMEEVENTSSAPRTLRLEVSMQQGIISINHCFLDDDADADDEEEMIPLLTYAL